jgi:hypothetical protein
MLDFDRRTVLIGSLLTAGATQATPSAHQSNEQSVWLLERRLRKLLALDEGSSWLLAERLKWKGKWPAALVANGYISPSDVASDRRPCSTTLRAGSVMAIYPSRFHETTVWRRVPDVEADVLGVHMSAYRSHGHLACLLRPQGAPAPDRIELEV